MNLLTLKCEGNVAFIGKSRFELPTITNKPTQIVFGIRPEDVCLADSESVAAIIGQAYLVEQLGKDNLVSVKIDDSETTIRALLPSDRDWQDQTIPLTIQPHKIHWFDVETGDRLD
jgi:multiple sugar transport system ATP-binding protein